MFLTICLMPNFDSSLTNKMFWSTVSKAADMSRRMLRRIDFWNLFYYLSNLNRAHGFHISYLSDVALISFFSVT